MLPWLWLRFHPWPGNFHVPWVRPLKKIISFHHRTLPGASSQFCSIAFFFFFFFSFCLFSIQPFHCLSTFSKHGSGSPLKAPLCPPGEGQGHVSQRLSCGTLAHLFNLASLPHCLSFSTFHLDSELKGFESRTHCFHRCAFGLQTAVNCLQDPGSV